MTSKQTLKLLLRLFGGSSLLALIFVAAPHGWMDAIHSWLGMGALPDAPVVGYLARSTSALYAMVGGLLLVISFDLERYRGVLIYMGVAITLFGALLLGVDWLEGMPSLWTLWEGPITLLFGLVLLFLSRGVVPRSAG